MRRRASIDWPAPGGPSSRMLWAERRRPFQSPPCSWRAAVRGPELGRAWRHPGQVFRLDSVCIAPSRRLTAVFTCIEYGRGVGVQVKAMKELTMKPYSMDLRRSGPFRPMNTMTARCGSWRPPFASV